MMVLMTDCPENWSDIIYITAITEYFSLTFENWKKICELLKVYNDFVYKNIPAYVWVPAQTTGLDLLCGKSGLLYLGVENRIS